MVYVGYSSDTLQHTTCVLLRFPPTRLTFFIFSKKPKYKMVSLTLLLELVYLDVCLVFFFNRPKEPILAIRKSNVSPAFTKIMMVTLKEIPLRHGDLCITFDKYSRLWNGMAAINVQTIFCGLSWFVFCRILLDFCKSNFWPLSAMVTIQWCFRSKLFLKPGGLGCVESLLRTRVRV